MAREKEGRPFHLVATHCQNAPKEEVVAYLRENGLAESTPNFTLTSFGGHPGVKGNGYVPYYMVFDHTGKLRRQHMAGAYHGGDGLALIEWVDRLLDETPDIWLGAEPYEQIADLARKASQRKGLGQVAHALETDEPGDEARAAEVARLLAALTAWRDRQVAAAERLLATEPDRVVDVLQALAKELAGSGLGKAVATRAAALEADPDLAAAITLQKALEKARRKIDRLKVPREAKRRGIEVFDPSDPDCRAAHARTLAREAERLREAVGDREDLPVAATVLAYVARLEG